MNRLLQIDKIAVILLRINRMFWLTQLMDLYFIIDSLFLKRSGCSIVVLSIVSIVAIVTNILLVLALVVMNICYGLTVTSLIFGVLWLLYAW